MKRRAFLGLGGLALAAGAFGGWKLIDHGPQPLLLSARDDADGHHYAVGYRLDGSKAFATRVAERCHDVVPHPTLPLAVFVGRRPSRGVCGGPAGQPVGEDGLDATGAQMGADRPR